MWLTDQEQAAWRSYLLAHGQLMAELNRRMIARCGLTLPDYEVLIHLSEAPEHRLGISELARSMHWERTRVSHQVARMTKRGLVDRDDCETDRRVAYAVITDAGLSAIADAAMGHADDVRELFLAPVGDGLDELTGASVRMQQIFTTLE